MSVSSGSKAPGTSANASPHTPTVTTGDPPRTPRTPGTGSGKGSTSRFCYVLGCHNGDPRMQKWRKAICSMHHVRQELCSCPEPFELHPFPSKKMDLAGRNRWIRLFHRADKSHSYKLQEPKACHRVCSSHFSHGFPTPSHPDPDQNLGHERLKQNSASEVAREQRAKKRLTYTPETSLKKRKTQDHTPRSCQPPTAEAPERTFGEELKGPIKTMVLFVVSLLLALLRKRQAENRDLKKANLRLQQEVNLLRMELRASRRHQPHRRNCSHVFISDKNISLYTGLGSKKQFNALHDCVAKYVKRRWRGLKCALKGVRKFQGSPRKFGPDRKLDSRDEFLLTLMRLRLGLVRDFLADLFGVSATTCTSVFNSWLTAMDRVLGSGLIFWPDKEQVHVTKPPRYRSVPGLRAIIDCSEVFLETPKNLQLQSMTWSNYKHHNTAKFLIAVAPNSMVTFLSKCYGGRVSDKAITVESGLLDLCDSHDVIQADKGFNINDECAARLITLHVPPGKRGQAQMSTAGVNKTKRIANLRILVEQAIRRIKTYRLLKYEVPVSLIPSLDKIVRVCGALCNVKKPIYKS